MKIKNLTKIFVLMILCILLVSQVSASTYPGRWDVWDQYWGTVESLFGINSNTWEFNEPPVMNWYPVEGWEIEECSKDYTSEFSYEDEAVQSIKIDDKVYAMTFVLNAEVRETQYTDINGKPEYLLTLGWYIQGVPEAGLTGNTIKYKIRVDSDTIPLNSDGDEEIEFTAMTGTSGFYTNYTTKGYTEATIIIDSQSYPFDIQGVGIDGKDKELSEIYHGGP